MTVYYLSIANGNDGDGLSKANASTTFAITIALMAAGDTLRVDSDHVDPNTGTETLAWPGTDTNPNRY